MKLMIRETTISLNGQSLFYRTAGKGAVVVLLHGFAEDGSIWNQQVDFLSPNFQLIVPDLPGSGSSPITNEIGMESMARTVNSLLDELKIDKCIMIGHSMGGYVTLAFAELYPEKLEGFGLFHSTAYADSDEKKVNRRRAIGFMQQYGAAKFLEQSIPNLFSEHYRQAHPEIISGLINQYAGFSVDSLIAYYEAMILRSDRTQVLQTTPHPVLFVMGRYDAAVTLQQGLQQCYMPAISQVEILNESGHMGMLEETAKANNVLYNFCNLLANQPH